MKKLALVAVTFLGGCTTLGPMPATTGMVAPAVGKAGVELQAGAVPGYYLSQSTREEAKGTAIGQAGGMIEPVAGVGVGARYVNSAGSDGYVEPMIRYRTHVDQEKRFTAVAVGYGTHAKGGESKADYSATRGGLELGADALVSPESKWAEVHAFAAASVTGLDVSGHYCMDGKGYGTDCGDAGVAVAADAGGFYPAGTAGVALDFGRHLDSVFHGGRLALMGSVGTQPALQNAEQQSARPYVAGGLTLTLGGGASK
ncbi:MAG: hypothetical protein H6717_34915 [Polyangiaceae bacterium]|nr:hypothetical protein [Polyangiaceae bacterium]